MTPLSPTEKPAAHLQRAPLRRLLSAGILCAGVLVLGACDKRPTGPPAPQTTPTLNGAVSPALGWPPH